MNQLDIIQTKNDTLFLKPECFNTYKHDLKAMTEIFGEHFAFQSAHRTVIS